MNDIMIFKNLNAREWIEMIFQKKIQIVRKGMDRNDIQKIRSKCMHDRNDFQKIHSKCMQGNG